MKTNTQGTKSHSTAWTKADYEYDMADRIVAACATLRHANKECSRIEKKSITLSACAGNPQWRYWDGQRGGAANEILVLLAGMRSLGYDTDPSNVGQFLRAKYHEMLRNEHAALTPANPGEGNPQGRTPLRWIASTWIEGMNLPEVIAIAPAVLSRYRAQFKSP